MTLAKSQHSRTEAHARECLRSMQAPPIFPTDIDTMEILCITLKFKLQQ